MLVTVAENPNNEKNRSKLLIPIPRKFDAAKARLQGINLIS
jgi:hypothetical protein